MYQTPRILFDTASIIKYFPFTTIVHHVLLRRLEEHDYTRYLAVCIQESYCMLAISLWDSCIKYFFLQQ